MSEPHFRGSSQNGRKWGKKKFNGLLRHILEIFVSGAGLREFPLSDWPSPAKSTRNTKERLTIAKRPMKTHAGCTDPHPRRHLESRRKLESSEYDKLSVSSGARHNIITFHLQQGNTYSPKHNSTIGKETSQ